MSATADQLQRITLNDDSFSTQDAVAMIDKTITGIRVDKGTVDLKFSDGSSVELIAAYGTIWVNNVEEA